MERTKKNIVLWKHKRIRNATILKFNVYIFFLFNKFIFFLVISMNYKSAHENEKYSSLIQDYLRGTNS